MSKAFTKEAEESDEVLPQAPLPELPPGSKNYITAAGARRMKEEVERLQEERRAIKSMLDPESQREVRELEHRIRHLSRRLQSVEVVEPVAKADRVVFGATVTRANLGYGVLGPTAGHVRVFSYQGAAPCADHALEIAAGSTLDVWVEDPHAECRGRDIVVASFCKRVGVDPEVYWHWPTTTAPVLAAAIETGGPSEKLLVLSVIEGSPWSYPNRTCGSEAATLASQAAVDGAILATAEDKVPASEGMGHLVLSSTGEVTAAPGRHGLALLAGSNFVGLVTTGGCCGDA